MTKRKYQCEFCDTEKQQEEKLVTVTRHYHDKIFVFENVPAFVCANCGHRYYGADVVSMMDTNMKAPPADARPVEAYAITLPPK